MTFDEYEMAAMRTAGPVASLRDGLTVSALGLCGEAGEFADLWKKISYHDHPMDTTKLCEELGDILWYVQRACSALDVTMKEVAQANIDKLKIRYPEKFSSERSINRPTDPIRGRENTAERTGITTIIVDDREESVINQKTATCPSCGVPEGMYHSKFCPSWDTRIFPISGE